MSSSQPDRLSDHLDLPLPRFLVAAYGPTLLASLGYGAVIPMLAIQALALGASHATAAFIAALVGIGQVVGDLPAGAVAARFGERRSLAGACLVDAALLISVFFTHHVWLFGVIVFAHGLTGSVYGLARQTYLTVAVPEKWRARAMSSMGGVMRVGYLVGPLLGALIVHRHSLAFIFLVAGAMSASAAVVTLAMPDTPTAGATGAGAEVSVRQVLVAHRHVLLSVGWGILALMLVRTARQVFIPLWCSAHGIDAANTNLIFAVSMAAEVLLFFPGGVITDRAGRWWATVPTMVIIGACFLALPATQAAWTIAALSFLLGVGNGVSSGIVSTLGADVSPDVGRPQFLAGWRIFGDVGAAIGPLVISLVTALASLAASALVLGAIGWAGAVHLARVLPRHGPLPPSTPSR
ncbi:MAG: MFS transporter [Actinomycetia bacterium]|nr:MFS transporter [Actinomycetes bacterium]